jgi:hypothetical protein
MYAQGDAAVWFPKTSEQARSAVGSSRRVILQVKRLWRGEEKEPFRVRNVVVTSGLPSESNSSLEQSAGPESDSKVTQISG